MVEKCSRCKSATVSPSAKPHNPGRAIGDGHFGLLQHPIPWNGVRRVPFLQLQHRAEHGQLWVLSNDLREEGEGLLTTALVPEDY